MLAVAATCLGAATASPAQDRGVVVIRDDPGGRIVARLHEIDRILATGQRVEIRGRFCHSTCTMMIGLPGTCVSAGTRFGFHGPSFLGVPMSARQFDYWSWQMARFYPPPLRDWFMRTGRHRIDGLYELSGVELIRMGIRECRNGGDANS